MTATAKMVQALAAPTEASEVKHRPGPGNRQLSYVDARFVMDRLDSTVGPESWQDAYHETALGVTAGIGIDIEGTWVWKWDVGTASDIEPAKGAYSDAFKRAGVKWGIARDLYDDSVTSGPARTATPPPVRASAPPSYLDDDDFGIPPESNGTAAQDTLDQAWAGEQLRDEGVCPAHRKPWRSGNRGWYCATKAGPGEKANDKGWCDEHPSKAWAARHERVPA